ncbi:MAG TPA: cytochrome P450 [Ktedonosporobacter sp.]|nr:cytochrome P450 [Ktedonosporobacter sp.]
MMTQSTEFDLTSAAFKADPYPTFAELRTYEPVHQLSSSQEGSTWLISRYADVEFVLRDERFIKEQHKVHSVKETGSDHASPDDLFSLGMGKFDPPDHTRLRQLVTPFFTPRQMELWRTRIQEIADELIDAVEEKGHMDLIEEFAFPLPLTVILEMLGMPAEDSNQLHDWTRRIVDALDDPVAFQQAGPQLQAFHSYLVFLVGQKQKAPANDLVSKLIQANTESNSLSQRELVAMIFLLIMAGYQTTGTLIGNGMLALLTHPDQLALLRQDSTLIKPAVEEFLRYRSPLMLGTHTWASEDIELGGKLIQRGDLVLVSLAGANRDEEIFAQPDALDITRQENRHLAFSKGIHYCLGAPLARLEGQIAINTLLRRLPHLHLRIDPQALAWRPGAMVLGLHHLPVVF